MDTLNDVMTDLLIDQDDRLQEPSMWINGKQFTLKAIKAEKIILDKVSGSKEENYATQN